MKKKVAILGMIIVMLLTACDWGSCKNCNLNGTPFPTLESEVLDGLKK